MYKLQSAQHDESNITIGKIIEMFDENNILHS